MRLKVFPKMEEPTTYFKLLLNDRWVLIRSFNFHVRNALGVLGVQARQATAIGK